MADVKYGFINKDELDGKLTQTTQANKIYGTDADGNQTLYDASGGGGGGGGNSYGYGEKYFDVYTTREYYFGMKMLGLDRTKPVTFPFDFVTFKDASENPLGLGGADDRWLMQIIGYNMQYARLMAYQRDSYDLAYTCCRYADGTWSDWIKVRLSNGGGGEAEIPIHEDPLDHGTNLLSRLYDGYAVVMSNEANNALYASDRGLTLGISPDMENIIQVAPSNKEVSVKPNENGYLRRFDANDNIYTLAPNGGSAKIRYDLMRIYESDPLINAHFMLIYSAYADNFNWAGFIFTGSGFIRKKVLFESGDLELKLQSNLFEIINKSAAEAKIKITSIPLGDLSRKF